MNDNEVRLIDANALSAFVGDLRSTLHKEQSTFKAMTDIEFNTRDYMLLNFQQIIDNAPTADDWENYSTKLWKEAYEQGKADRPKGEWTVIGLVGDYAFCKCSECGNITRLYRDSKNEFCCIADIRNKVIACLYCGADMRKGGADNDT